MQTLSISPHIEVIRSHFPIAALCKPLAYSSGCLSLDIALSSTRGYSRKRQCEISGETGTGKTTLALHAICHCQATGGIAAFLDAEFALDPSYASKVGVDMGKLLFSQPRTAEQAFSTILQLIESDSVQLIVVDSIAAMLPRTHLNRPILADEDAALEQSRVLAKGFAKVRLALKEHDCIVLYTNQLRQCQNKDGNLKYTSVGGRPVANFMATRIRLEHGENIYQHGARIGHRCHMSVRKHKDGSPGGWATVPLIYEKGLAVGFDTYSKAINAGVVSRYASGIYDLSGRYLGSDNCSVKESLECDDQLRIRMNGSVLDAITEFR